MPFPGISVGDLGPKLGFNATDNGYLSFDQYRIPRRMMMMRFVLITREGDFELNGDPRLIYRIMVSTRMLLITGSSMQLMRGVL
jgi:acyl-CoA oxidase